MSTENTQAAEAAGRQNETAPEKDRKKQAAAGAVALFTSVSMLLGGVFNPPAVLPDNADLIPPAVYSEDEGDDLTGGGGDGGSGGEEEPGTGTAAAEPVLADEERLGLRARLRQRILRMPMGVRLLIVLAVWAMGYGLLALLGGWLTAALGPLFGKLAMWAMLLAAILGGFALAVKTVFPDLPLKKIINKRSVSALVIAAVVLGAADCILPLFWAGYSKVEVILRGLGTLLVTGTAVFGFTGRERRRRAAAAEAEAPEAPEETRPLSRQEILALADSAGKRAETK